MQLRWLVSGADQTDFILSIQQNSAFISCFFRWVACGGAALLPEEDAEPHRYIEISRKSTRTRTEWCSAHSCVSQDPVRSFCAETGCSDLVSNARLIKLPVLTHPGWMQWWRVGYGYSYPVMLLWSGLTSSDRVGSSTQVHTKPLSIAASSQLPHAFFCTRVEIFSSTKTSLPRKVWHQARGSVIKMNHPGMTSETWTDAAAVSLLEVGMFDCSID